MARRAAGPIEIYDTTLRDGAQSEDIDFSSKDKLRITTRLDQLGFHFVEGGWPGSNPKDVAYFRQVKSLRLKSTVVVAFGSTRHPSKTTESDPNLKALVESGTKAVCIFGKSWDLHVIEALRTSLPDNLDLIGESVGFLKHHVGQVFYDAEHFFDGFRKNPEYALATLKRAARGGADRIILADTNGGTMTDELVAIFGEVKRKIRVPLGIHCHNDADLAVANSLAAVRAGAIQVQGTVNGFGERSGNANLISIIPSLELKMGHRCLPEGQLAHLRDLSRFVYEMVNRTPEKHQPYVGDSAFAHKAGIHVSAILRNPETYEHIRPELVGNTQRILVSDLSGRSTLVHKAKEFGIDLSASDPASAKILEILKARENEGYQFEGAEASFELLMLEALGRRPKFFELIGVRVIDEKIHEGEAPLSEATIKVRVKGKIEHTAAEGNGPVNALDSALRKALVRFYRRLGEMELTDFKVRVLTFGEGTAAKVRVFIESSDGKNTWGTVGVSGNIIEASWQALADAIDYKLIKDKS
jgi:2-isopropylmalate synthase